MTQTQQNDKQVIIRTIPVNNKAITLDETEREALEAVLKEIILNLPIDPNSAEEVYRSDVQENRDHFQLFLCSYEMRALRRLLGKIR
ncbi:MAG: hypothetical protein GY754_15090 [bacterium]|nr:hypothetical protein [bacterium]